jgi:hypothetical protein
VTAVLLLLCWRGRRGCDEQVHLGTGFSFLGDFEQDLERMAHGDGRVVRQDLGVLGFVPVGGELIGAADRERVALDTALEAQRFRWLKPGAEGLIGEIGPGAIEQAIPDIGGGQGH